MEFLLRINSNDAACTDDPYGEIELAFKHVLKNLSFSSGGLSDTNGNHIGGWRIFLEEESN